MLILVLIKLIDGRFVKLVTTSIEKSIVLIGKYPLIILLMNFMSDILEVPLLYKDRWVDEFDRLGISLFVSLTATRIRVLNGSISALSPLSFLVRVLLLHV